MSKIAPKHDVKKTECYAYITKTDTTIRYDWFTEEEFKKSGFIKVDIGSFPEKTDRE